MSVPFDGRLWRLARRALTPAHRLLILSGVWAWRALAPAACYAGRPSNGLATSVISVISVFSVAFLISVFSVAQDSVLSVALDVRARTD